MRSRQRRENRITITTAPSLYHRALVGEKRRIGRGVLEIRLLLGGSQLLAIGLTTLAALVDAALGATARVGFTPLTHAVGIISVTLRITRSMMIQRWLYKMPVSSLSSMESRLRWDFLGRSDILIAPAFAVILMMQYWNPLPPDAMGVPRYAVASYRRTDARAPTGVCEALIVAWRLARSRQGATEGLASDLAVDLSARNSRRTCRNFEYAHGQMVDAIRLQLQSVVTLLRLEAMMSLRLWTLLRLEIEYAGPVGWLLGPFPGVGVGWLRVARGMLEHLATIQRQQFTAGTRRKVAELSDTPTRSLRYYEEQGLLAPGAWRTATATTSRTSSTAQSRCAA